MAKTTRNYLGSGNENDPQIASVGRSGQNRFTGAVMSTEHPSRLTLIGDAPNRGKRKFGLYRCTCGEEREFRKESVKSGKTRSCGCWQREKAAITCVDRNTTYGLRHTPEYRTWIDVKMRCRTVEDGGHEEYGGRGIVMCVEWDESFERFYADMGPKPTPEHSIDRIDVNGNYEPGNCKWSTPTEQGRNKRNSVNLTYQGRTQNATAWAEELGLDVKLIYGRLESGWTDEESLTIPRYGRRKRHGKRQ